jgi:hypothetical protein
MSEVAGEGRTVLFVSHNMGAIQNLCSKCVWLRGGELASEGESQTVIREYLGGGTTTYGCLDESGRVNTPSQAIIRKAWLEKEGARIGHLIFGDQVDLIMEIEVLHKSRIAVELVLRQADGVPVAFAPSGRVQDLEFEAQPGSFILRAGLPPALLALGTYSIDLRLLETDVRDFDQIQSGIRFHVDSAVAGLRNWAFFQKWGHGHVLWDVKFEFLDRVPHTAHAIPSAGRVSLEREA